MNNKTVNRKIIEKQNKDKNKTGKHKKTADRKT